MRHPSEVILIRWSLPFILSQVGAIAIMSWAIEELTRSSARENNGTSNNAQSPKSVRECVDRYM